MSLFELFRFPEDDLGRHRVNHARVQSIPRPSFRERHQASRDVRGALLFLPIFDFEFRIIELCLHATFRVVPETAHAAFDKAAHYFRIKIRHVSVDPKTKKVNLKELRSCINSNTCMVGWFCVCSFILLDLYVLQWNEISIWSRSLAQRRNIRTERSIRSRRCPK